jgi:hypothetical protein
MNLSSPKKTTLWIAVLIAVLSVAAKVAKIAILAKYSFVCLAVAFVLLLLGCVFKNF